MSKKESMNPRELVEELSRLTVLEALSLVSELEEKWGVSATQVPQLLPPYHAAAYGGVMPGEPTFDVILSGFPKDKKLIMIKIVRQLLGLGLKETKALVESAPVVLKEGFLSLYDAQEFTRQLEHFGGVVEFKKIW